MCVENADWQGRSPAGLSFRHTGALILLGPFASCAFSAIRLRLCLSFAVMVFQMRLNQTAIASPASRSSVLAAGARVELRLLGFLPKTERPLSWPTKGGRSK